MFHKIFPADLTVNSNFGRNILRKLGYFKLRTYLSARGKSIPDSESYLPLYSPWEKGGYNLYKDIYSQVESLTLVSLDRCYVLANTYLQAQNLDGDIIECGVYKGGTALFITKFRLHSKYLNFKDSTFHLFDTFEGLPEANSKLDVYTKGVVPYDYEKVKTLFRRYLHVKIHKGLIPDIFKTVDIPKIAWAHVDVDLYKSVLDSLTFIYPRLVKGGYIVFDDYGFPSCPGARAAVDHFFVDKLEVPLCLQTGQAIVIKL